MQGLRDVPSMSPSRDLHIRYLQINYFQVASPTVSALFVGAVRGYQNMQDLLYALIHII
jgi:hypothetical protein